MLTLERKSKRSHISVSLRDSGRLATPAFLKALAAAFALHLAGFLLFQVSPFKIRHGETIFPPVQVRIDYEPFFDSDIIAELENDPQPMSIIPEPAKSEPRIQTVFPCQTVKNLAYPKMTQSARFPFEKVESSPYSYDFFNISPTVSSEKPSVGIHLSGGLSGREFNREAAASKIKKLKRCTANYRVKVEERTGKIFWFEPVELEEKKLDSVVEPLLTAIRFKKNPGGFISEGFIEIAINPQVQGR